MPFQRGSTSRTYPISIKRSRWASGMVTCLGLSANCFSDASSPLVSRLLWRDKDRVWRRRGVIANPIKRRAPHGASFYTLYVDDSARDALPGISSASVVKALCSESESTKPQICTTPFSTIMLRLPKSVHFCLLRRSSTSRVRLSQVTQQSRSWNALSFEELYAIFVENYRPLTATRSRPAASSDSRL